MRYRPLLLAVLFLCIATICAGARFSYTWKDAEGNLFITDYAPPDDAEVLDVRIIPMPEQPQVDPEIIKEQQLERQSKARRALLTRAAELKKEEQELRRQAADLTEEAGELRRLAKKLHYKQRYRRRAALKEEEAADLANRADELARQADALERQAGQLE